LRQLPLSLTVDKSGFKSKALDEQRCAPSSASNKVQCGSIFISAGNTHYDVVGIDFQAFPRLLGTYLDRPLVDKTGLSGRYDLQLQIDGNFNIALDASALSNALKEQLGLKLDSSKGPVEMLVIDSAQRPTVN
jgi:uncharacterized protein (TIGR03435 family)